MALQALFAGVVEDVAGLEDVVLAQVDAGPLEADGAGGVAELLGLLEGLEGLVVLLAGGERPAEVKGGQCGVGVSQVLDRLLHVAEEVEGDAELQVQLLGVAGAALDALGEDVGDLAQRAELVAALGQAVAELLDGAGVAVLVFDQ